MLSRATNPSRFEFTVLIQLDKCPSQRRPRARLVVVSILMFVFRGIEESAWLPKPRGLRGDRSLSVQEMLEPYAERLYAGNAVENLQRGGGVP